MKVAILAGGMGTRLAEETEIRPKPMVEIGGRPILWHIMRHFDHYGYNEFVIALGYKGDHIRRFFSEYHANASHLRIDLGRGLAQPHGVGPSERWVIDLIETGVGTNTGGRIARLAPFLGDETFMLAQQLGNTERLARAHDVIENRSPDSNLEQQVDTLHRRYLQLAAGDAPAT